MLSQASVVVGILGPSVPPVTSEELLEGIRRYSTGDADNVMLFVEGATKGPVHHRFLDETQQDEHGGGLSGV